ncbi:MAG: response regulator [Nitrospirae bacterium]|nr:response regulator [Nitrospirota bacterium]
MMQFHKRKILIADNSHTFLMYMGLILKRMGFAVIRATSGLEVLKLLKLTEPDVITLDPGIEGKDSYALLNYIKEDKQTSGIPVIMISTDSSKETMEKCMQLGCSGYLLKPIKIYKLHEALQEHIFFPLGTRRRHVRVPFCEKIRIICNGASYELFGETLCEGGIYVMKKDPLPVGSEVEVTLPLEGGKPIRLMGTVIYRVEPVSGVFKHPPGMAIEFRSSQDDQTIRVRTYVEKELARDIFESQEEIIIEPQNKQALESLPGQERQFLSLPNQ